MRKRKRILTLLALLTAAAGAWAQATATTSATRTGSENTYKVKMKEGTKDAAKWTIASDGNSTTGDKTEGLTVAPEKEVTLTYSGRLKVKSVTATHDGWDGDLSNIPASAIASDGYTVIVPDGTTLTGDLDGSTHPYKIVIPDGAMVTLAGVDIDGENNENYIWAGINCEDGATIILADNTTNVVKGFHRDYPGIYIAECKTLIIKGESLGTGKLTASSNGYGCGIGGGNEIACGNIEIQGGDISANGGEYAAGIGSGNKSTCGSITISGGTIVAYGNDYAAGIGCGYGKTEGGITTKSICGNISISKYVTIVTATKGMDATNSIGISDGDYSSCGTVTIGCELGTDGKPVSGTGTVYYDGETKSYQNGGDVYLAQSPLTLVNLGKLTGNYEAPNGTTLFGTLNGSEQPYKVSIADKATVTLDGVDIEGVNDDNCPWAGLTCAGDATIILNDGSENTVKGFHLYYPGIFVRQNKTLTIKGGNVGNGKLSASPFEDGGTISGIAAGIGGTGINDCGSIVIQGGIISATGGNYSAGIGGSEDRGWGNITISGGEVTAKGGDWAAGIGSGFKCKNNPQFKINITGGFIKATGGEYGAGIGSGFGVYDGSDLYSKCGDITISGGTVEATGGENAAGIGTGYQYSRCGEIRITSGVDHVTATKGKYASFSIGVGDDSRDSSNFCSSVMIGNSTGQISTSPYTYRP